MTNVYKGCYQQRTSAAGGHTHNSVGASVGAASFWESLVLLLPMGGPVEKIAAYCKEVIQSETTTAGLLLLGIPEADTFRLTKDCPKYVTALFERYVPLGMNSEPPDSVDRDQVVDYITSQHPLPEDVVIYSYEIQQMLLESHKAELDSKLNRIQQLHPGQSNQVNVVPNSALSVAGNYTAQSLGSTIAGRTKKRLNP